MPLNLDEREKLRKILQNEKNVKAFFGSIRRDFVEFLAVLEKQKSLPGDPRTTQLIGMFGGVYENVSQLTDIVEASFMITLDIRQELNELVQLTLASDKGSKTKLKTIARKQRRMEKEVEELNKVKRSAQWVDEFLKRAGRTGGSGT